MDELNQPEQLSSLDKFKRQLERHGSESSDFKPTIPPVKDFKVQRTWVDDNSRPIDYRPGLAKKTNIFLWRLFWGALIFFLATMAVAIYILFFSPNIVLGNNIDLVITGPAQIRSGDELNLAITVVNKNKVTLGSVDLVLNYPSGTMDPVITDKELLIQREELKELTPGQAVNVTGRAIIFGGQNTSRTVKVTLEYRIPDSNALFTKEKIYTVTIGSSSLDLNFQLPSEVNIGKEFTGTLKVTSNAQGLLRNCAVQVEWPAGFNFVSANPAPVKSNNVWFLGDLIPGAEKEISFTGSLAGQSGDWKSFKILAGLASGQGQDPISLEYGNSFQTVNLKKDFVSTGIYLADESGRDQVIFPSGKLAGDIVWRNNLTDKIINSSFDLKLNGSLINKRTVQASGFYNSINNTISWDERILPELKLTPPDEGGQAGFSFNLLPLASESDSTVKEIKLQLTFRGTRLTGENQTEEIVTETEKTIKVSTLSQLVASSVYHTGPFKNTGPLPPKVGQETTYTINWTVSNTINDLANATARTILPPSVKWLGQISPLDEKVVYNQTSGEVVWSLGPVLAGAGDDSPTRQVSFQISLLPSLSQVGKPFNLTSQTAFSGQDTFTGAMITRTAPAVSTELSRDPNFSAGQGLITE